MSALVGRRTSRFSISRRPSCVTTCSGIQIVIGLCPPGPVRPTASVPAARIGQLDVGNDHAMVAPYSSNFVLGIAPITILADERYLPTPIESQPIVVRTGRRSRRTAYSTRAPRSARAPCAPAIRRRASGCRAPGGSSLGRVHELGIGRQPVASLPAFCRSASVAQVASPPAHPCRRSSRCSPTPRGALPQGTRPTSG